MNHFFVPADQAWIIENLKDRLSAKAAERIAIHTYLSAEKNIRLEPGSVIFTGLGVLTNTQRKVAKAIWDNLDHPDSLFLLMNHPTRSLGRYDLLKRLYEKGMNCFRAFRTDELKETEPNYPVFVREEFKHTGSLTDLIYDQATLEQTIEVLCNQGYKRDHLLIVEYLDTSDSDGFYRKYSVQVLDSEIIPRYLSIDKYWVVKENTPPTRKEQIYSDFQVREEIQFMKENPHKEKLQEIFSIAGIKFGRIDYGIKDGEIQTWEINTLPTFGRLPGTEQSKKRKKRIGSKEFFYNSLSEAFLSISSPKSEQLVELNIPSELASQIRRERIRQQSISLMVKAGEKIPRIPVFTSLRTEIKRRIRGIKER